jgi:hypothetical protein
LLQFHQNLLHLVEFLGYLVVFRSLAVLLTAAPFLLDLRDEVQLRLLLLL